MLKSEAQVLKLCLYLVQTQSVCQWSVNIQSLTCNLILFVGRLTLQSSHVVKTVAYLNDDNTNVVTHREQQLLEVLGLCRSLFAEDTTTDLCKSVNNLCNLCTEDILDVFNGVVGILNNIVQQCGTDTC